MVITHEQKIEVGRYYVLGYTVSTIEELSGISHGAICAIIKELESSKLQIPGVPSEIIADLRQIALQIKKGGKTPSQTLLGSTYFDRCMDLGVTPACLEQWNELEKSLSPSGISPEEFISAALHLHQLEKDENATYSEIVEKFSDISAAKKKLDVEVADLSKEKTGLGNEIAELTSELAVLKATKIDLISQNKASETKLKQAKEATAAEGGVLEHLRNELEALHKKKNMLEGQIGGRQESLNILKEVGLSETHLMQLKNTVVDRAQKNGLNPEQLKSTFFAALIEFGGVTELQQHIENEKKRVQDLKLEDAQITGRIKALEAQRAALSSEIKTAAAHITAEIRDAGKKAVDNIEQCADAIKTSLKTLAQDALSTGAQIHEELEQQAKAEKSANELESMLEKIKSGQVN